MAGLPARASARFAPSILPDLGLAVVLRQFVEAGGKSLRISVMLSNAPDRKRQAPEVSFRESIGGPRLELRA